MNKNIIVIMVIIVAHSTGATAHPLLYIYDIGVSSIKIKRTSNENKSNKIK